MTQMKYSTEELFKLIGELTGYGPTSTSVTVTYNPARRFNGFGESEGFNLDDWGYAVSTKICSTDNITVDAQDRDLDEALWKLAKALVTKTQDIHDRWKRDVEKTKAAMTKFLDGGKK